MPCYTIYPSLFRKFDGLGWVMRLSLITECLIKLTPGPWQLELEQRQRPVQKKTYFIIYVTVKFCRNYQIGNLWRKKCYRLDPRWSGTSRSVTRCWIKNSQKFPKSIPKSSHFIKSNDFKNGQEVTKYLDCFCEETFCCYELFKINLSRHTAPVPKKTSVRSIIYGGSPGLVVMEGDS